MLYLVTNYCGVLWILHMLLINDNWGDLNGLTLINNRVINNKWHTDCLDLINMNQRSNLQLKANINSSLPPPTLNRTSKSSSGSRRVSEPGGTSSPSDRKDSVLQRPFTLYRTTHLHRATNRPSDVHIHEFKGLIFLPSVECSHRRMCCLCIS